MSNASKEICEECGRERREDEPGYNPLAFAFTGAVGWYSGDDGVLCTECFKKAVNR